MRAYLLLAVAVATVCVPAKMSAQGPPARAAAALVLAEGTVYIGGKECHLLRREYDPRQVTDFALTNWTELYTQARVAELGIGERRLAAE